jgi:drug/metabolite transporter (DMT)-like permease
MSWQWQIALMALLDVGLVIVSKYWSLHVDKWQLPLLSIAILIAMQAMFLSSLVNGGGVAKSSIWYSVLSAAGSVLVGLAFGEHLTSKQIAGIALGLVALWLIE